MSEQSIFLSALDISDTAERAAYLATACGGNDALRKEVEMLLAAHERPGQFLDAPAVAQMVDSGAGETRTVAAEENPDFAETRAPDSGSGSDEDVLAFLQPPTRAGSLGRLAHYEVQEVLGRGGFGTVLKAFDDRLHRVVAIKVMAPQLAVSGAARRRFERENRSAAAVRDDHVVNVHAVSDDDAPLPYLVMEFVSGQTLQQKLDKVGPLSVAEVLRIGSQIARGLAAAHATGLIHRDIKPANILLENGVERVKITDFGLARAADDASISQSGVVAGTPMYMAPEQARGDSIDHRADLFSLGSVLYAMCTGRPPFRAETTLAVLKRVCEDDPRPVREVNPAVPQWLADVVAKLHAKNPADRFQSAKEVADLLAKYLTELQMQGTVTPAESVRPTPTPRPFTPTFHGWPGDVVLLCALVGVCFVAAACRSLVVPKFLGEWEWLWLGNLLFLAVIAGMIGIVVRRIRRTLRDGRATRSAPYRSGWKWKRAAAVLGLFAILALAAGFFYKNRRSEPAVLTVHTDDPDVVITLDGQVLMLSPFTASGEVQNEHSRSTTTGVTVGEHRIWAIKDGKVVFEEVFWIGPGENKPIEIPRSRPPTPAPMPSLPADGWVQLFNGKDLTGWHQADVHRGEWIVANGVLTGTAATSHLSALYSNRIDYENFHLRVEVRAENSRGDLFFRTPLTVVPKGYVAPVLGIESPLHTGVVRVFTGDAMRDLPICSDVQKLADRWVTLEIIANGSEIETRLDGTTVTKTTDASFRRGHIALFAVGFEVHGGPRAGPKVMQFRKIEIKELPPSPLANPATIDLIPLAKPDPKLGTWKRDGNILDNRSWGDRRWQFLPIHVALPREYEFEVDFERLEGGDTIGFIMSAFGASFCVGFDSQQSDGGWSGLALIEKKFPWENETGVRGLMLKNGTRHTLRCTVRETGIVATFDGKPFVNYTGGYAKLDGDYTVAGGGGAQIYVQSHTSTGYRIYRMQLTPLPPPLAVAPFAAAKAKEHQESWARHLGVPVEYTNSIGMKLRLIPPGEFTMGTPPELLSPIIEIAKAGAALPAELPGLGKEWTPRTVLLTRAYYLGTYEVTRGQFRKFVEATKYKTDVERDGLGGWSNRDGKWVRRPEHVWMAPGEWEASDDEPVVHITWRDARAFCEWLSRVEGQTYVLPTEAQWEFACRAGTTGLYYPNTFAELREYAWTSEELGGPATHRPQPVGLKKPNAFGLFDMLGNVWENCADYYSDEPRSPGRIDNPTGPLQGKERVARGGGWYRSGEVFARCSYRGKILEGAGTDAGIGFRVAIVGDLKPKAAPPAVAPFDAKKAKEHQDAWAKHLGAPVETTNSIGMKMRLIPPGEFTMGATLAEFELFKTEDHAAELKRQMPNHTVKLTKPYRVGATEVTVGQFRRFVKDAKYKTEAEADGTGGDVIAQGKHAWKAGIYWDKPGYEHTDDCPVTQVSWNDAAEFCNWLSRKEKLPPAYVKEAGGWRVVPGPGYRLPTEAEWEFACRAGSRTSYFFGDDPKQIGDYAWHKGNADGHPHSVGEKLPNPFGLFDVLGNVREWVADWDDEKYAPQSPVTDPQGAAAGTRRVMRGSGWSSTPIAGPSAFRSHTFPRLRLCYLGFRVAQTADAAPPAKEAPDLAVLQPLRDAVAARGRTVAEVKLRFEAGKASKLDLLAAQVELREANIKLAEAEENTPILILHLRELVKLREEERELIKLRVEVGVDRMSVLDEADARLADAKVRLAKLRPPEIAPPPRPKP